MSEHKWDLTRLSAGERSALKRNAGVMMNAAGADAIEGFYRALTTQVKSFDEPAWFAALCLQCLWREDDRPQIRTFPEMLRAIYMNPDATESSRKKCISYMDVSWGQDGFLLGKICNLVRKMRADNASVMPNFEALADDLTHWNHPDRYIQRKWLREICKTNDFQNEEEEENVD